MPTDANDREYMTLAIEEAKKARSEPGKLSPKVGAIVVKDGCVLVSAFRGELAAGEHAEFTALEKKLKTQGVSADGATVYTTLEPCTERGKGKMPCFKWLLQHKVRRVVVGIMDPNAIVAGRGVESLRDAGVEVDLAASDQGRVIKALDADWIAQYDENRRPWRSLPSLKLPRERHASVPFRDGVLVTGGLAGHGGPNARVECEFLNAARVWEDAPPMQIARTGHTATILLDGSVLVVGGFDPHSAYPTRTELLGVTSAGWTAAGDIAFARFGHTATRLLDGRVLVCGGYFYDADAKKTVFLNAAEVFDPAARKWERMGDMLTPRDGHTATLLHDGRVLIVGGRFMIPGTERHLSLREIEVFDASKRQFAKAPPLLVARARHAAILSEKGVLVVGGAEQGDGSYRVLGSCELLGLDGSRARVGDLKDAREASIIFETHDGPPLVIGGHTNDNLCVGSTERFDPVSATWVAAPAMKTPRYCTTAVSLPTDRGVLVAGGLVTDSTGRNPTTLTSVELFQH